MTGKQHEEQLEDFRQRVKYHRPDYAGITLISENREFAWQWGASIVNNLSNSRERSLALTKIEEALFWANAAIARDPQYQEE